MWEETVEQDNTYLSAAKLTQQSAVYIRDKGKRVEDKRREEAAAEIWLLSDDVKRKLNNAETRQ